MRSMTGYGRGEVDHGGAKFSVELYSVNRKQSDIVVNLPRDLTELEPRVRQVVNEKISRGRTTVSVGLHESANGPRNLALDTALAKVISPFERIFGITLLGTQTAKQIKFFGVANAGSGGGI